ncbi:MAG TPA: glutathione transferase GstA [Arenimonas sp.]|uniref:glutathione transferase GstA n=1 Tax=Arenimonas sp. TaxID=1872635 RepID=UPI002CE41CC0|nr:glutathione transferase GstA [Arenimonas sp.]HMB56888.1 glutathione transferase GstA [Arenimonas sp.]
MKLFYSPGACSLSPHIALREAGLDFELVKVDLKTKTTEHGADFTQINPYGYVPALQLDNGEVLLEGPAIVQYIADQVAGNQLAPMNGTIERYRVQSALTFINSELHKTIGSLFNPTLTDAVRQATVEKIDTRLKQLSAQMDGKDWIANGRFSVADPYLFVVLGWLKHFKIDVGQWPVLKAHADRLAARPAVQAALQAEGLA